MQKIDNEIDMILAFGLQDLLPLHQIWYLACKNLDPTRIDSSTIYSSIEEKRSRVGQERRQKDYTRGNWGKTVYFHSITIP